MWLNVQFQPKWSSTLIDLWSARNVLQINTLKQALITAFVMKGSRRMSRQINAKNYLLILLLQLLIQDKVKEMLWEEAIDNHVFWVSPHEMKRFSDWLTNKIESGEYQRLYEEYKAAMIVKGKSVKEVDEMLLS